MKWWPRPLEKGDMIRVRVGSVYHYGIFVSEDEVIQFGPPPTAEVMSDRQNFCVMASDIDAFSGGVIVEAASPETKEERKRFSPRKAVKLARGSMGEQGYDIIHNNCEHFVYWCVYGVKRSTQAEEARRRWHERPQLNVYVLPLAEDMPIATVYPPERDREIREAGEAERLSKYAAWCALERALAHSFGVDMKNLTFRKTRSGKWVCAPYSISLTHTAGAVAVAVSNSGVGVDIENVADYIRRHAAETATLADRALCADEQAAYPTPDDATFLALWTRKESRYKYDGEGRFDPLTISAIDSNLRTVCFALDEPMVLSVYGDRIETLCLYRLDGERPCRMDCRVWEGEWS